VAAPGYAYIFLKNERLTTNRTVTIVYIPNVNITFSSGVPTSQLEYPKNETIAMIANGVAVIETGGVGAGKEWGTCLGCAIMEKSQASLPKECGPCFTKYCYHG